MTTHQCGQCGLRYFIVVIYKHLFIVLHNYPGAITFETFSLVYSAIIICRYVAPVFSFDVTIASYLWLRRTDIDIAV